jgi:enamine deaminase RidA (YjgF/YER057c/UK114 family)
MHELLHPSGWKPARGYANGVAASGRTVFVGGMIGWNAQQEFETDDFIEQVAQALRNIVEVLAEGGALPEHLVRLTWYVTDRDEYVARQQELGRVYREIIGKHFPAMALVQVVALVERRAKVEIEATAVVAQ